MKKTTVNRRRFKESKNVSNLYIESQILDSDRQYCNDHFNTLTFLRKPFEYERRQSIELYGQEPMQMQVFALGNNLIVKDYLY